MKIIGCDFHPSRQQVAVLDKETGELWERSLEHANGEAEQFYASFPPGTVRIGIEASGNTLWFERMLARLGHELWFGDAAVIHARATRKQKTDRRDAQRILDMLDDGTFPRIWVPSVEWRDERQLLLHRHKLVGIRTKVKNCLQHLALNQGLQRKRKLWTKEGRQQLEALEMGPWTGVRRRELLGLLDEFNAKIDVLDQAVAEQAQQNPDARLLMTHPGVGPVTSLAFVLTLGPVTRFKRGKQVASYLGLAPSEHSSNQRRRLGSITKQGNTLLRTLLVEAGQSAARYDEELLRAYRRLARKRNTAVAKVMVARRLAVRLYWILREQKPYRSGSHGK